MGRTKPAHAQPAFLPSDTEPRVFRVMTYNIHHGRGTDRRYDLGRIAKVIAHENPDVVALQEVERYRLRTGRIDQPGELARELEMDYAFSRVQDHRYTDNHHHAAYGNAILTKFPLVAHEHFDISYNGASEPRGCLHATIEISGTRLHVFCVHLGLQYRERNFQIGRLLSEDIVNHRKFGEGPRILLGDFNNWWPVQSAKAIQSHFHDACVVTGKKKLRTFGQFFTFLCLDYVFTSPDLKVLSCMVSTQRLARTASDHRPVVCEVRLPDESPAKAQQAAP